MSLICQLTSEDIKHQLIILALSESLQHSECFLVLDAVSRKVWPNKGFVHWLSNDLILLVEVVPYRIRNDLVLLVHYRND